MTNNETKAASLRAAINERAERLRALDDIKGDRGDIKKHADGVIRQESTCGRYRRDWQVGRVFSAFSAWYPAPITEVKPSVVDVLNAAHALKAQIRDLEFELSEIPL